MFSFSARINKQTPVKVKLADIGKLTGQDSNRILSTSMTVILQRIKACEIVVDEMSPAVVDS